MLYLIGRSKKDLETGKFLQGARATQQPCLLMLPAVKVQQATIASKPRPAPLRAPPFTIEKPHPWSIPHNGRFASQVPITHESCKVLSTHCDLSHGWRLRYTTTEGRADKLVKWGWSV